MYGGKKKSFFIVNFKFFRKIFLEIFYSFAKLINIFILFPQIKKSLFFKVFFSFQICGPPQQQQLQQVGIQAGPQQQVDIPAELDQLPVDIVAELDEQQADIPAGPQQQVDIPAGLPQQRVNIPAEPDQQQADILAGSQQQVNIPEGNR